MSKQGGAWACQPKSDAERAAIVSQATRHPFCKVRGWIQERGQRYTLVLSCGDQLVGTILPDLGHHRGRMQHSLRWLPDGSGVTFWLCQTTHRRCTVWF